MSIHIDTSVFTINEHMKLEFVTDNSMLTIKNTMGESWEFPYETNRVFELDDDKRYVMLIEEHGYARLLASDYLAARESARLSYPGLTPDYFSFRNVFDPDCVFEDRGGVVYTATVRKGKGEYVFEDDDFHKRVVIMCERLSSVLKDLPRGPHITRGVISELEYLDKQGDPSRYMPTVLIDILEKHHVLAFTEDDQELNEALTKELNEIIAAYKDLKRV